MVSSSRAAVALLSFASAVYGLAYTTPEPTSSKDNHARVEEGWSPRPTEGPNGPAYELLKREMAGADTCGWYGEGTSSTMDLRISQIRRLTHPQVVKSHAHEELVCYSHQAASLEWQGAAHLLWGMAQWIIKIVDGYVMGFDSWNFFTHID
jgi:hypothetical protein